MNIGAHFSSSATSSLLLPNLHLPSSSLSRSILNPFSSLLFFSTRIYVFSFVFFSIYLMVVWIICFLFSSLEKLNIKLRFLFFSYCFVFFYFYFSIISNYINVIRNFLFFYFSFINNCIDVDGNFLFSFFNFSVINNCINVDSNFLLFFNFLLLIIV